MENNLWGVLRDDQSEWVLVKGDEVDVSPREYALIANVTGQFTELRITDTPMDLSGRVLFCRRCKSFWRNSPKGRKSSLCPGCKYKRNQT